MTLSEETNQHSERALLPLREKVACEAGRMRGFTAHSAKDPTAARPAPIDPSSVGFADTFSRKGTGI